jgi:hypothetical protein
MISRPAWLAIVRSSETWRRPRPSTGGWTRVDAARRGLARLFPFPHLLGGGPLAFGLGLGGGRVGLLLGLDGAALQGLVGRGAIQRLVVEAGDRALGDQRGALLRRQRAQARGRRPDQRLLDDAGRALGVQGRDQRLADPQGLDGLGGVEGRIDPERLGGGLQALLVGGGVGAQGVLHPGAQLAQHRVGNVGRVLGDEIDAHALGADQPHDLLDLLQQRLFRVVEQQVGLVEEEHQLGFVGIADLGQFLEQLRQQPQQEGRIELGRLDQLVGGQQVDVAAARRRRCA